MTLTTTTHLNFPGSARSALEFYQGVFGGESHVVTYAEFGMPADLPGADKVAFGQLDADSGFRVMAYDVPGRSEPLPGATRRENGTTMTDQPFFLSVRGESMEEVSAYWDKLAEGA